MVDTCIKSPKSTNKLSRGGFTCRWCSRPPFARQSDLTRHHMSHIQARPYKCDWEGCSRAFNQLGNLKTHRNVHTGEKPFKCGDCTKEFGDPAARTRHRRAAHDDMGKYKCSVCNLCFKRAGSLENHDRVKHNGLRPSFTDGKHPVMAELPSDRLVSGNDVSASVRAGASLTPGFVNPTVDDKMPCLPPPLAEGNIYLPNATVHRPTPPHADHPTLAVCPRGVSSAETPWQWWPPGERAGVFMDPMLIWLQPTS